MTSRESEKSKEQKKKNSYMSRLYNAKKRNKKKLLYNEK